MLVIILNITIGIDTLTKLTYLNSKRMKIWKYRKKRYSTNSNYHSGFQSSWKSDDKSGRLRCAHSYQQILLCYYDIGIFRKLVKYIINKKSESAPRSLFSFFVYMELIKIFGTIFIVISNTNYRFIPTTLTTTTNLSL